MEGWYALTPHRRRDRAGHRAGDHPRPAAAEGVGTGRARGHAQGHRHHGRPVLGSTCWQHLGVGCSGASALAIAPPNDRLDLLDARRRVRLSACPPPRRRTRSPCACTPRPTTGSSGRWPPRSPRPAASSPRSTSSTRPATGWSSTSPARPATPTTATKLVTAVDAIDGVEVYKVSDRTFLLHIGGKIEVHVQGPAEEPRRPVDGLHPGRRAGQHGAGREPRGRARG